MCICMYGITKTIILSKSITMRIKHVEVVSKYTGTKQEIFEHYLKAARAHSLVS